MSKRVVLSVRSPMVIADMYAATADPRRAEATTLTNDDALFAVGGDHSAPTIEISDRARPGPSRWQPLLDVFTHLDQCNLISEADHAFVAVVLTVAPDEWPHSVIDRLHRLATTTYRIPLEEQGWDVDLLPFPPPADAAAGPGAGYATAGRPANTARAGHAASGSLAQRAHHAASSAPATAPPAEPPTIPGPGTVTAPVTGGPDVIVSTDPTGNARVYAPPRHPLRTGVRDVPGATWDGTNEQWVIPVARQSAIALRAALTGHPMRIDRDLAARLKDAADAPAAADLIVAGDRIEIRFLHTPTLQADVKRLAKAAWDGDRKCWFTPLSNAPGALAFADTHKLMATAEVVAAAERRNAPFDYDGTIDGLRGVPVSELHAVRAVPARGKTPSLEQRLADFGVTSIYDLLNTVPFRYQDRSATIPIRDLKVGDEVGFLARVTRVGQYDRNKKLVRLTVSDGTADVSVTFFRAPWVAAKFRTGDEVVVYGRLDVWTGGAKRTLQMSNPIMDPVGNDTAKIVPVYPQSEKAKISTWDLHSAAMEAVRRLGDLQDPFPETLKSDHDLLDRAEAYRQVHNPDTVEQAHRGRTRLAFDELFRMQIALGMRRYATADETGLVHQPTGLLVRQYMDKIPYALTGAQARVLGEIKDDLLRPHPMSRLLQGDVGSGKSTIAAVSLLYALESGYQGALMAPTEILASQLFAEMAGHLTGMSHPDGRMIVVEFLAAKTKVKDKRRILAGLADGSVDLVVGTHALLVDDVVFANLGLVVIDEQHRFGVEQRAALRAKGPGGSPDMLLMTATPIPRTAALTIWGDLSVSVLDELPPGRTPIKTSWLDGEPSLDVLTGPPWDLVRSEVEAGRQAYVVASLVEDNETIAAQSAEYAMEALTNGALNGLRLGLVHGKQKREDREATMREFKDGNLDVLVATTVIEVGVNVPNATVMVILDATRFGIAQLHQIRGRVGRGAHASHCILTGKAGSQDAVLRMQALVESTDGFYLSEVDLNLRGEGSVFGARQSGQSDLRVASLREDRDLLVVCRNAAEKFLDGDPKLLRRPGLRTEVKSEIGADAEEWLTRA